MQGQGQFRSEDGGYLGYGGDERGLLVTSDLKELRGIFESLEGGAEAARSSVEDKGRRSASIEKRFQSLEEYIFNLKSRVR